VTIEGLPLNCGIQFAKTYGENLEYRNRILNC
jgi:hypothetical protein